MWRLWCLPKHEAARPNLRIAALDAEHRKSYPLVWETGNLAGTWHRLKLKRGGQSLQAKTQLADELGARSPYSSGKARRKIPAAA